ncbi:MAG: NHLP leader peptide family RiPP precursor [Cyanobacteria bacterium J06633_8]
MADNQGQSRAEFTASLVAKAWQDENFKNELMGNPKAVIQRESGKEIPDNVQVTILEENPNQIYFVIPTKPEVDSSEELSDEALEAVAGGGWFAKKKKNYVAGW